MITAFALPRWYRGGWSYEEFDLPNMQIGTPWQRNVQKLDVAGSSNPCHIECGILHLLMVQDADRLSLDVVISIIIHITTERTPC